MEINNQEKHIKWAKRAAKLGFSFAGLTLLLFFSLLVNLFFLIFYSLFCTIIIAIILLFAGKNKTEKISGFLDKGVDYILKYGKASVKYLIRISPITAIVAIITITYSVILLLKYGKGKYKSTKICSIILLIVMVLFLLLYFAIKFDL